MHLTINPLIFLYFLILDSISIVFTTLSTLFLDEHVVETIALQKIDIGIDVSIAPVEETLWSGEFGECLKRSEVPIPG